MVLGGMFRLSNFTSLVLMHNWFDQIFLTADKLALTHQPSDLNAGKQFDYNPQKF